MKTWHSLIGDVVRIGVSLAAGAAAQAESPSVVVHEAPVMGAFVKCEWVETSCDGSCVDVRVAIHARQEAPAAFEYLAFGDKRYREDIDLSSACSVSWRQDGAGVTVFTYAPSYGVSRVFLISGDQASEVTWEEPEEVRQHIDGAGPCWRGGRGAIWEGSDLKIHGGYACDNYKPGFSYTVVFGSEQPIVRDVVLEP